MADIASPLMLSFAALYIACDTCKVEALSVEHIVACLEAAGVAVRKSSVAKSLVRASDRVSYCRNTEGDFSYKLMTKGRREIEPILGSERLSVLLIEAGQPRTARLSLGEILSRLRGIVRICDPYYGIRSLDTLDNLPKNSNVRFLTARTNEKIRKIDGALRDFKTEHPRVEFRIVANPSELHDRYVLTNDQLMILGHGLKDIGGKESFIIRLDTQLVPDLIKEITSTFDARWTHAKAI